MGVRTPAAAELDGGIFLRGGGGAGKSAKKRIPSCNGQDRHSGESRAGNSRLRTVVGVGDDEDDRGGGGVDRRA